MGIDTGTNVLSNELDINTLVAQWQTGTRVGHWHLNWTLAPKLDIGTRAGHWHPSRTLAPELVIGIRVIVTDLDNMFLASEAAGFVTGKKDLIDAVYLQNRGIGRPMKAGKGWVMTKTGMAAR